MPKLDEILADAGKSLGVRRIYGDPYEKNGVTVIPAARVMGGAGGGGAVEAAIPGGADSTSDSPSGSPATGSGVGFGMSGRPVGAFVIKGDDVRWLPAIDVNRVAFGFQLMMIVLFLVVRSVLKSHDKALTAAAKAAR